MEEESEAGAEVEDVDEEEQELPREVKAIIKEQIREELKKAMTELSTMQKQMMESDIEKLQEQKRKILADFENEHPDPTPETQRERQELDKNLEKQIDAYIAKQCSTQEGKFNDRIAALKQAASAKGRATVDELRRKKYAQKKAQLVPQKSKLEEEDEEKKVDVEKLPNNVKAAVYLQIRSQLLDELKRLDEKEMETTEKLREKILKRKQEAMQVLKKPLTETGKTGDDKALHKALKEFETQRKLSNQKLDEEFLKEVDEQRSFIELDRSVLRDRAKSKEQGQLEEIVEFVNEMMQDQEIDLPLINKYSKNFKTPLNEAVIQELKASHENVPQLEVPRSKLRQNIEAKVMPEPQISQQNLETEKHS